MKGKTKLCVFPEERVSTLVFFCVDYKRGRLNVSLQCFYKETLSLQQMLSHCHPLNKVKLSLEGAVLYC